MANISQDLINKIQKILNLADKDKNNSTAEAENAMRLAKKLMSENDLTISDIEIKGEINKEEFINIVEDKGTLGVFRKYEYTLAAVAAKICGITFIRSFNRMLSKTALHFIGTETDVAVAKFMFNYLCTLTKDRGIRYAGNINNHKKFQSFSNGFAYKLYQTACEQVKFGNVDKNKKYELVVVNKEYQISRFMQENYNRLQKSRTQNKSVNFKHYHNGMMQAKGVNLSISNMVS